MNQPKLIEGILEMKFKNVYHRFTSNELTCEEAADILGISVKTFFRKRQRYNDEGFDGRFDLRLGKPSPHRAADHEVEFITTLYSQRFRDFNIRHFCEFVSHNHNITRSYTWVKNTLMAAGLVTKSTKGGKHRLRRERRPMAGMMLHQDGSTHLWIPALGYNIDLIVTMDDATSTITSAFFVSQEGTFSSFRGLMETIENYGLFCSLYTDRGSHYFHTPEAGGKVNKSNLTEVGRALRQLKIKHIAAYGPQGRGRSERMFGSLQGRLPQELALKNIQTIDEANKYLKEVFIPRHNQHFTVEAKDPTSAYVKCVGIDLKNILCIQEERTVQADNTIRYNNLILQIPKNEYRHHYAKTKVDVHSFEDGSLEVFYGHISIGRYDMLGNLVLAAKKITNKEKENVAA